MYSLSYSGAYPHSCLAEGGTILPILLDSGCCVQVRHAVGEALPVDIPEHTRFENYGPDYSLHVTHGNRQDENTKKSVEELSQTISGYLSNMTSLPT